MTHNDDLYSVRTAASECLKFLLFNIIRRIEGKEFSTEEWESAQKDFERNLFAMASIHERVRGKIVLARRTKPVVYNGKTFHTALDAILALSMMVRDGIRSADLSNLIALNRTGLEELARELDWELSLAKERQARHSPKYDSPPEPNPFDLALVELLMGLSGIWTKPDFDSFSHTQEKALSRLTRAGLVEQRFDVTASMRGFPNQARMQCRVSGQYDHLLWKRLFEYCPEWLTPDGKTCNYLTTFCDSLGVRLTDQGELAQSDGRQDDFSYFLLFVRGHGPIKEKYAAGSCGVEKFWTEPQSTQEFRNTSSAPHAVANASASIGDIAVHNQMNFAPQIMVNIDGAMVSPTTSPKESPIADTVDQATPSPSVSPPTAKPNESEENDGAGTAPRKPAGGQPVKRNRGRPADTDPKEDKRIFEVWKTGRYKKQAHCDHELGLSDGATYAACERHRKRLERRNKRRRTK